MRAGRLGPRPSATRSACRLATRGTRERGREGNERRRTTPGARAARGPAGGPTPTDTVKHTIAPAGVGPDGPRRAGGCRNPVTRPDRPFAARPHVRVGERAPVRHTPVSAHTHELAPRPSCPVSTRSPSPNVINQRAFDAVVRALLMAQSAQTVRHCSPFAHSILRPSRPEHSWFRLREHHQPLVR